jgi:hypothetical protein
MSDAPSTLSEVKASPQNNDEIDLLALFTAAARTWRAALAGLVLVSLLYWAYQLAGLSDQQSEQRYGKAIQLSFSSSVDGQYPNGAVFRLGDIVAPSVLQAVYNQQQLADQGISIDSWLARVTVEPYTPEYALIVKKFDKQLANKKLTVEQIETLHQQQKRELAQAEQGGARIWLANKTLALPEPQLAVLAKAIVDEWERQLVTGKGVLKTALPLVSVQTLDAGLFENVDYVVLSDLLKDKVRTLQAGIAKLKRLDGIETISDPASGLRLEDLSQSLGDFEVYVIDELMSPVRSLGLTRNGALSSYYYGDKKRKLEERLALLEEEAGLIKNAYDAYGVTNVDTAATGAISSSTLTGVVPQLGDEFLGKLLELGSNSSVENYRQALNDRWLNKNLEVALVKSELREIESLLLAVSGNRDNNIDADIRQEYLDRVKVQIPQITTQLKHYYQVLWGIYDQVSFERAGGKNHLYRELHGGVIGDAADPSVKRLMLMYLLALVLTVMVIVPAAMIRNAIRR